MALFGPRLDRPTAIGDEGRPRATSMTIASVVVFALLLVTGYTAGILSLLISLATLTGLLTVGLALLNRERFLALFLGQLCYVLSGTGMVGLLGAILLLSPSYGMVTSGFALALIGLASTWADVGDRESTRTALFQGGVSYITMLVWFVVLLFVALVVLVGWGVLTTDASTIPPTPSFIAFLLTAFASSLLVLLGTRWLPIRQLTPRERRPRMETHLRHVKLGIAVIAGLSLLAVIVTAVAWVLGGVRMLYETVPPVSTLFSALSSPFVLGGVLSVGVVVFLLAVLALFVRRATRPVDASANRLLAGVLAGFAFTILILPFVFSLVPLPLLPRVLVTVLLVFLGPVALLVVGATLILAVELDVLPDRAGGPALAAGGMVMATIGAGLVGVPGPVVFACAAGGMLVWDVSSFGLGVTAELGHIPETRRLELFHGVLAVGVGAFVVAVLTGLDFVRTGVVSGLVAVPAVLAAVVAVLVMLVPVRG